MISGAGCRGGARRCAPAAANTGMGRSDKKRSRVRRFVKPGILFGPMSVHKSQKYECREQFTIQFLCVYQHDADELCF